MIRIDGVTKRFGEIAAVDRATLSVKEGDFLTLVGPSGCGKTTLLRILSGFERPDEGRVHVLGRDVTDLPPYKRNVNQVFQSYALFPHMTVRENISFGLRMQGMAGPEMKTRVAETMALVALGGLEDRKPDQLSGGQRQRVALARAIAPWPSVLLLDEPLSALDAKLRQQMQAELKGLQRRLGITFILVTHDRAEALAMGDHIAVMNEGRIEQFGPPEEVYRRPATAFVADFIAEANIFAGPNGKRVSVRPERVLVSPIRDSIPGVRPGRIVSVMFHGAAERLVLEGEGGMRIVALVPGRGSMREGDAVWFGFREEDVHVLPDAP